MPSIKKLRLPSGNTYDIVDEGARELISELLNYTTYLGVTTTELTDGATTNPITIDGQSVTAVNGNIATYNSQEFIFNGTIWQKFGDLSALGALAYKNSVAVSTTATGSVSAPTISVNQPGTTAKVTGITSVGSMPTYTVENETLIFTAGATPTADTEKTFKTGDASYTASQPTFTGNAVDGVVTYSPS